MTALRLRATCTCRRARGRFPALVGVHGGGWVQGVRGQFQHWGKYLAARGVALFAISYRLAKPGQKTFPHAVQDVLAGIQFVRGNAKDLNIAPDRIGVFGHSAGGNLGALAALGGLALRQRLSAGSARQGQHRRQGVCRRLWRL
jgi:acetyl esterase/lipase